MLNKDKHRLLKRQMRKCGIDPGNENYARFLDLINDAYHSFDADVYRLENILEQSSKELFKVNQYLLSEKDDAKSQLKSIVNSVQGVLFETDKKGNFTYLNQGWNELTGLSWKRSLGKNYRNLLLGLNNAERLRINDFLRSRQDRYHTVFKYIKPNKEVKWIDLNLSVKTDSEGNNIGTVGTMMDVTELKEIEIELKKANKAKDDFLSTMSHEIRTPLNAVIGLSNVLLMDEHLPNQVENLEALKYSGEHLLGLINNILDLNKLQSGNVHYVENEFSLDGVVKELETNFRIEKEKKNIDFEIVKDEGLPDQLLGDRLMLIQVIKNLLSNAFKFTDEGFVRLEVLMKYLKQNEVNLTFKVSDTGIGIPKEKQKSIFESFVQAENNTSRLYGGTGLGLTISRKLLNMQNSELQLNSSPGEGSCFWFNIKFKVVNSSNVEDKPKEEKITKQPINLKVLVAEDNKLNQMVLKKLFANWNVFYKITNNGQELYETYLEEDYDLILMDIQMPILDGYQTTTKIRKMKDAGKAKIPIIALTAFAQEEARIKTAKFKMNGFMTKPFDPNEFHQLLNFYGNKIQNAG